VHADDGNVQARLVLGLALVEAGRGGEAADHLRRGLPAAMAAARANPRAWDAQRALALCLAASGNYPAAVEAIGQALSLGPPAARPELLDLRARFRSGEGP